MRFLTAAVLLACGLLSVPTAQAISPSMAQTGFSGLLRIPDANALPFADLSLQYSREENIDFDSPYAQGAHKTILMGVGLLPGLEFTLQNTHKQFSDGPGWSGTHSSDLSFSAKYDFKPFLPEEWFSFALGVQDYGGAASNHKNAYAVASKAFFDDTLYNFRLTAGYGKGHSRNQMGGDYLQGPFVGIEWQPTQWLQFVGDYDGTGVNSGIKIFSADNWLPAHWKANFTYQAYSNSATDNRDNSWFGLGLTLPLATGMNAQRYTQHGVNEWQPLTNEQQQALAAQVSNSKEKQVVQQQAELPALSGFTEKEQKKQRTAQLLTTLVEYGFENVRLGWRAETLVVSLENNLFNWNELDALGVALGLITEQRLAQSFEFYLLNNQIPVLKVTGNSEQFRNYLQQTAEQPVRAHGLSIASHDLAMQGIVWSARKQAASSFVPRLIFSPHLRSALGTELGVFDYSLALSSNVQLPLWKGAVLDVRHLLPVMHSDSYDDGEYFADSRHKSEVDRILFHQAFALPGGIVTQLSLGQIYKSYRGLLNETYWQSTSGLHRVKAEVGHFSNKDDDYDYRPLLLSYRYFVRALELALEGSYGQHWAGDLGGSLSLKQWFGDMSVNITYQNTKCDNAKTQYACANDGYATQHEYAGLTFQFPLGTRKNSAPAYGVQIKTQEQWGYGYRSRINNDANYIGGNRAGRSNLQYNIEQQYFNRDRLSKSYIESNMQRLRASYIAYSE